MTFSDESMEEVLEKYVRQMLDAREGQLPISRNGVSIFIGNSHCMNNVPSCMDTFWGRRDGERERERERDRVVCQQYDKTKLITFIGQSMALFG